MNIDPFFIALLSIPEIFALWVAYRKYRSVYLLLAMLKVVLLGGVYVYIGFFDPTIEQARAVARITFVFMQSIGAFGAISWLASRKAGK